MATTIQQNQIGMPIQVAITDSLTGLARDLTGATITYVFLSPVNVRTTKTGSIVGNPTNGVVVYLTQEGDLNFVGSWQFQIEIFYSSGGNTFFTGTSRINVRANL